MIFWLIYFRKRWRKQVRKVHRAIMKKVQNDDDVTIKSVERLSIPMKISISTGWWCSLFVFYTIYGPSSFDKAFPNYRYVGRITIIIEFISWIIKVAHLRNWNEVTLDNRLEIGDFNCKYSISVRISFEIQFGDNLDIRMGKKVQCTNFRFQPCLLNTLFHSDSVSLIFTSFHIINLSRNVFTEYWFTSNDELLTQNTINDFHNSGNSDKCEIRSTRQKVQSIWNRMTFDIYKSDSSTLLNMLKMYCDWRV